MLDAVRLAVGTLTIAPVTAPRAVNRGTWRSAIALAPLIGVALGGASFALGWLALQLSDSSLLAAVTAVGMMAASTRGLHLDGLADVADGLGSRRPPAEARAIMRQSDIGPFGVLAVVFAVLGQVAALQITFASEDTATAAVISVGAAVISRAAIVAACRRGQPTTPEGLGSQVVGSVPTTLALAVVVAALAAVTMAASAVDVEFLLAVTAAGAVAFVVAELWRIHCVRRLSAVTGDVLGSILELSATTFLVVAVLVA